MSSLSTHILDTSKGKPAAGVVVRLCAGDKEIGRGITNSDGRCTSFPPAEKPFAPGVYRLIFEVDSCFPDGFYPEVAIAFFLKDTEAHYHVPLLISPFGFTTYRGS